MSELEIEIFLTKSLRFAEDSKAAGVFYQATCEHGEHIWGSGWLPTPLEAITTLLEYMGADA